MDAQQAIADFIEFASHALGHDNVDRTDYDNTYLTIGIPSTVSVHTATRITLSAVGLCEQVSGSMDTRYSEQGVMLSLLLP